MQNCPGITIFLFFCIFVFLFFVCMAPSPTPGQCPNRYVLNFLGDLLYYWKAENVSPISGPSCSAGDAWPLPWARCQGWSRLGSGSLAKACTTLWKFLMKRRDKKAIYNDLIWQWRNIVDDDVVLKTFNTCAFLIYLTEILSVKTKVF